MMIPVSGDPPTEFAEQRFDFPWILDELVRNIHYKAGWQFTLGNMERGQHSYGLTLRIFISPPNAYHPEMSRPVNHIMPVPPAAFNRSSWMRWLLDQILLVEQHEACEFFEIDGVHPYGPSHGPGNDPYTIRELSTEQDQKTAFTGKVNE